MRRTYEPPYAPSDYDEDMCLKPPLLLWLAVLFLSRAVVLPLVSGLGHVIGVDSHAISMMRDLWSEDQLLPAVLAIPVLIALFRRAPAASSPLRWIWAKGRLLLGASAALDLVLPFANEYWRHQPIDVAPLSLCTGAFDLYFLAYIIAARRMRDTFSEFPPPIESAKT